MQKKFIKVTSLIISIAMALTIVVAFLLQTFVSLKNGKTEIDYLLNEVSTKIAENDVSVAQLKESLGQDYLARARAFSYMISQKPEIVTSAEELQKIVKLLDVDEVHVTDENGVIHWGTVPDYYNFDMRGAEQTAEFIPILSNPSLEIAQEPQPNGTKNILFQYIGVSRLDKTGIVQIGMQPSRLESALENNKIEKILERYCDGSEGVFALDQQDVVIWHENDSLIGKTAEEIGLKGGSSAYFDKEKMVHISGEKQYIRAQQIDDYIIVAEMDNAYMMSGRNMQILVLLVSDILVVLVMISAIGWLLRKQIVTPMGQIVGELKKIEEGDLNVTVNIHSCPEFSMLSGGINTMVGSIRTKMEETAKLLENQKQVALQIHHSAGNLDEFSQENLETANHIADGATEQAASMEELAANISTLAQQMKEDTVKASQASEVTLEFSEALHLGMDKLQNLVASMHEVNQMSNQIKDVVNVIDNISFQTNMLALNAAVEAARAGEAGKGFSVVAEEVRMLAGKSAESAKQTADMIGRSIQVMGTGEEAAVEAAKTIQAVLEKAQTASSLTNDIAAAADKQTDTIIQIRASGEQISNVIQNNSQLAEEGRTGVSKLMTEIQGLRTLAEESL